MNASQVSMTRSLVQLYDLVPFNVRPASVLIHIVRTLLPVPELVWDHPLGAVVGQDVGLSGTWDSNPQTQELCPAHFERLEDVSGWK